MWAVRNGLRLKAVALALPEVLSRCGTSVELAGLLKDTQLTNKPCIEKELPDGDWEALVCNTKQTCEAYHKSVLMEARTASRYSSRAQRSLFLLFFTFSGAVGFILYLFPSILDKYSSI